MKQLECWSTVVFAVCAVVACGDVAIGKAVDEVPEFLGEYTNPGVAADCVLPEFAVGMDVGDGTIDFEPVETWSGYFGVDGFPPGEGSFTLYVKERLETTATGVLVFDGAPGDLRSVEETPTEGFAFSIVNSVIAGDRWEFELLSNQWLRPWCEQQASFLFQDSPDPEQARYQCLPPGGFGGYGILDRPPTDDSEVFFNPEENVEYSIDARLRYRCAEAVTCFCNSCGCTADITEMTGSRRHYSLKRTGNEIHGTSSPEVDSTDIHMTLVTE